MQEPLTHWFAWVLLQLLPQAPQCEVSAWVSWQLPLQHSSDPVQAVSQAPQWLGLSRVTTQVPPQ